MRPAFHMRTVSVVLAAGLVLGGCAALPRPMAWLFRSRAPEVRMAASPVETAAPATAPVDRAYAQAVIELRARRYGAAVDLLQMARQRAPDDPRVLDALAVAYDKLGRFDLSARYYKLALAADPTSAVIQANMRYSARLQGQYAELASAPPPKPAAAPAPVRTAALETGALRIAVGSETAIRTPPAGLIGSRLVIVDASGRPGGAAVVRSQLAARGWSVAQAIETAPMTRAASQISYPAAHGDVAAALARTLPFPVRLAACADGCTGLRLIVGATTVWKS